MITVRWSMQANNIVLAARAIVKRMSAGYLCLSPPADTNKINSWFLVALRSRVPSRRYNRQNEHNEANRCYWRQRDRQSSRRERRAETPTGGAIGRFHLPAGLGGRSDLRGSAHDCQFPSLPRGARGLDRRSYNE